jgi:hypothetical protein
MRKEEAMSGWLKVEKATPKKPEVRFIARQLSISRLEVFGRLFEVWSWIDNNTVTDKVPLMTKAEVDEEAGLPGFADAMEAAGWLVVEPSGEVSFPNFGRHNSDTAKRRAQKARENGQKGNR